MSTFSSARRAITLIESILTISVLLLIIAILLPSVQAARESARSLQCKANLRQMGQAVFAYHATHGMIPGWLHSRKKDSIYNNDWYSLFSVQSYLLPFLGNSAEYDALNINVALEFHLEGPIGQANETAAKYRLGLFLCPSDGKAFDHKPGNSYRANWGVGPYWHASAEAPDGGDGFFSDIYVVRRLEEISDGLTYTSMFSERLTGSQNFSKWSASRDVLSIPFDPIATLNGTADKIRLVCASLESLSGTGYYPSAGKEWITSGMHDTHYTHAQTPNASLVDCQAFTFAPPVGMSTARSHHPNSVMVAMGDGSVRAVSSYVDFSVWRAIGTRAGGEVVVGSSF